MSVFRSVTGNTAIDTTNRIVDPSITPDQDKNKHHEKHSHIPAKPISFIDNNAFAYKDIKSSQTLTVKTMSPTQPPTILRTNRNKSQRKTRRHNKNSGSTKDESIAHTDTTNRTKIATPGNFTSRRQVIPDSDDSDVCKKVIGNRNHKHLRGGEHKNNAGPTIKSGTQRSRTPTPAHAKPDLTTRTKVGKHAAMLAIMPFPVLGDRDRNVQHKTPKGCSPRQGAGERKAVIKSRDGSYREPLLQNKSRNERLVPNLHRQVKTRRKNIRQISPFLKILPGEIRNKIYEHVIPSARIMIFATSPKAEIAEAQKLWENQDQPLKQPRVRLYCALDRRQLSSGMRLSSSMLLVNRQISREVQHFLYSRTSFCFPSLNAAGRFLNKASQTGIASIRSVELDSGTYGEPYLTENRIFKVRFERKWHEICDKLGTQTSSLTQLKLYSHTVDWPLGKIEQTGWHEGLMQIVKLRKLEDAEVHLTSPWINAKRMAKISRKIEESLMTPKGHELREEKEHQHYLRMIREAEEAEVIRRSKLPPVQASKCLRITLGHSGKTPSLLKTAQGSKVTLIDGQPSPSDPTVSNEFQSIWETSDQQEEVKAKKQKTSPPQHYRSVKHWEAQYGPGNTLEDENPNGSW